MLKTQLHAEHTKLNAKMAPFAGFDMPIQYTSVKEEVIAVRQNVGMFDVGHMGEFFVEGPEAESFVDYIITNDFKNAAVGKAVYSPLCRENGTVIDDLIAYKISTDKILICVNASNIEKDWKWISSQKGNFNCKLSNHSDDYSLIALQGPKSIDVLKTIGFAGPEKLEYYSLAEMKYENETVIVARTGYTGEDGFELFCSHQMAQKFWERFFTAGVKPCGLAARDVLRLEVCYPLYGHELNDELTPLDSGLKWTVKGAKEKFVGKNALQSYQPKFQLIKLSLERGIPRDNYEVLNEAQQVIGKVTSGTMSVALNKGICFALIEKGKTTQKYFVKIRENLYEATKHDKAFITGGHK